MPKNQNVFWVSSQPFLIIHLGLPALSRLLCHRAFFTCLTLYTGIQRQSVWCVDMVDSPSEKFDFCDRAGVPMTFL